MPKSEISFYSIKLLLVTSKWPNSEVNSRGSDKLLKCVVLASFPGTIFKPVQYYVGFIFYILSPAVFRPAIQCSGNCFAFSLYRFFHLRDRFMLVAPSYGRCEYYGSSSRTKVEKWMVKGKRTSVTRKNPIVCQEKKEVRYWEGVNPITRRGCEMSPVKNGKSPSLPKGHLLLQPNKVIEFNS